MYSSSLKFKGDSLYFDYKTISSNIFSLYKYAKVCDQTTSVHAQPQANDAIISRSKRIKRNERTCWSMTLLHHTSCIFAKRHARRRSRNLVYAPTVII